MQLMIDIETLGKAETSVVLQIGLCAFDREAGTRRGYFEVTGDLFAQMAADRTTDHETVHWWKSQPPLTWGEVSRGKSLPHEMVAGFCSAYQQIERDHGEITEVWAKGAAFDFPILEHLLKRYGAVPWKYWMQRCFRTFQQERDREKVLEPRAERVAHTAGSDALHQAEWLLAIDASLRATAPMPDRESKKGGLAS